MNDIIGTMIGNYRLNKLLGNGGMGSVYEATDVTLQREVALKMMHPHLAARENFQRRFLQEARAIAKLEHPNIVKIYQANYQDALPFYLSVLSKFPDNSNVNYRIGQCYMHILGEQNKALPYLQKSVNEINPKYMDGRYKETGAPPEAWLLLGDAYHRDNQLRNASFAYYQYKSLIGDLYW